MSSLAKCHDSNKRKKEKRLCMITCALEQETMGVAMASIEVLASLSSAEDKFVRIGKSGQGSP